MYIYNVYKPFSNVPRVFTVPPMLTISNQLVGGYLGQNIKLECHTEAFPTSINFWTTEKGDMIVSGKRVISTGSR